MARAQQPSPDPTVARRPCVGWIETQSIARGLQVADAVLWQAEIEMLFCESVSPGKFILLFTGDVEAVSQSLTKGCATAGPDLLDECIIPNLDSQVFDALRGKFASAPLDAIGIIETTTIPTAILAADAAIKTAMIHPVEFRMGNQLGGKAFITFVGEVGDLRTGIAAGADLAASRGHLFRDVVIAGPHPSIVRYLRAR